MTVDGVLGSCRKAYSDWCDELINPRMIRIGAKLTWHGDRHVRVDEPLLEDDVAAIVSAGAFSMQVRQDEAVIQLMYEFDRGGRRLQRASLAYFGLTAGAFEGLTGYSEASAEGDEGADSTPEATVLSAAEEGGEGRIDAERSVVGGVSWLRIDYEDGEPGGVLHHDCHMHVGGFPDGRLPLNCVPNPRQFIEWIFAFRYPELYRRQRLDASSRYKQVGDARQISTPQLPIELRDVALCVPHLAFPKGAIAPGSLP